MCIFLILLLPACTRPASIGPLGVRTVFPTATVGITPLTPALPEATLAPVPTWVEPAATTGAPSQTGAFPNLAGLLTRDRFGMYLYDGQGYAQQLTPIPPVSDIAVNDQGVILYSHQGDLFRYAPGDGGPSNLTDTPDRVEVVPRWLPDEPNGLLCLSSTADQAGETVPYHLTRIGPITDEYEILAPEQPVEAFSISPDGRRVALDGGRILDLDTGEFQAFTAADYGLLDPPDLRLGAPAWSPDGRWLAWNTGYTQNGGFIQATLLIDLELGAAFELPFYLTVAYDGLSPAPLWSPDGRYLAIDVHAQDASLAGVWIYPAGGAPGAEFRLDADLGSAVGQDWAWSPDGARLAVSMDGPEAYWVYLFESDSWNFQVDPGRGKILAWLE